MFEVTSSRMVKVCIGAYNITFNRKGSNSYRVAALRVKRAPCCCLELESTCNLDHAVQSTAADGVRRSDLTERWTIHVEDGVAGSTQSQTRGKNAGQEVGVVENVECVRADLE